MTIRIHAHHFKVSDALNKHIKEKFSSLEIHDHDITNIEVTLLTENKLAKVEAEIKVPGIDIFASSENEDIYVAINKLIPKLDRQIKKKKGKTQDR